MEIIPSAPPSVQTSPYIPNPSLPSPGRLRAEPKSQQGANFSKAAAPESSVPGPSPARGPSLISSCPGSAQLPCTCSVPGAHEASGKHAARFAGSKQEGLEGADVNRGAWAGAQPPVPGQENRAARRGSCGPRRDVGALISLPLQQGFLILRFFLLFFKRFQLSEPRPSWLCPACDRANSHHPLAAPSGARRALGPAGGFGFTF